jgi:hypothetical protein
MLVRTTERHAFWNALLTSAESQGRRGATAALVARKVRTYRRRAAHGLNARQVPASGLGGTLGTPASAETPAMGHGHPAGIGAPSTRGGSNVL